MTLPKHRCKCASHKGKTHSPFVADCVLIFETYFDSAVRAAKRDLPIPKKEADFIQEFVKRNRRKHYGTRS